MNNIQSYCISYKKDESGAVDINSEFYKIEKSIASFTCLIYNIKYMKDVRIKL